jgi:hypothetical protein
MKKTKQKHGSFGGTRRKGGGISRGPKEKKWGGEGVEAHEKDQKKTKLMVRSR